MQQLTQKLKDGKICIHKIPIPKIRPGTVLVRNYFSLISPGTESGTVKTARQGLIGKAKERPQQVKQVMEVFQRQGPIQTYRAVMKKLDTYSPLGYSSVGRVIDTGHKVKGFEIDDFVACGGLDASHSEVVRVPVNLCVKLNHEADIKQAAYNTLGAIALQGVRQANLHIGETCAIIGLGLLGQLTALILKASGVRTVGIDIEPSIVELAQNNKLGFVLMRDAVGIENKIAEFTDHLGCDAVIITAASASLEPINFAGAISRHKGTIVVVGAVPTGFDREPNFYKKELQVKMSCSYGPGRYDPIYEEKGIDYPPGHVRWTEKRNMQAFQELIYSKKIDVSKLTTHIFKLEEAPAAYDIILGKSELFIGILIEYDAAKKIDLKNSKIDLKQPAMNSAPSVINIGFIGAGSYAQSHLLPNIPKAKNIVLKGVMTNTGTSSRSVAERFGFEFCTGDEKDIIENAEINTVFIATRHDSHAYYVMEALKNGKHVFVEKPLCLTIQQLDEIAELLYQNQKLNCQSRLIVGYNRRFSPFIKQIKNDFVKGPMAMTYRVNAGEIPKDSWIQDQQFGGGRILGEVCHFVDTLTFLTGSFPVSVYANAMYDPSYLNDTLNVTLHFSDGSIGTISYFSNGDRSLTKERLEVFAHGATAIVDDFREMTLYANGRKKRNKLLIQDKGQRDEVKQFVVTILKGKRELIQFKEIYNTSVVTFKIIESIRKGLCVKI